ncbi:hypothetical protein K8R42_02595, partial [bacterium]|nr:hypothetical protein [bacterium]
GKKTDIDQATCETASGDKKCDIKAGTTAHEFCTFMFTKEPKEYIDWSIVYEKIQETEVNEKNKNKKMINDIIYSINKKIKNTFNTKDNLFSMKNKTVSRDY